MVDRILTRPMLQLTTFIKRHWLVVLVVLLLLWLAPSFFNASAKLLNAAFKGFTTMLGWFGLAESAIASTANKVLEMLVMLINWLETSWHRWGLPAFLFPFFPGVAALMLAWLFMDKWLQRDKKYTITPETG